MIDWLFFTEQILPHKKNTQAKLFSIDLNNQIGTFFQKSEKTLYFGFIKSNDQLILAGLVQTMIEFAKQNHFRKMSGPIDGATWSNYRFQWQSDLDLNYPGRPSYRKEIAEIFINQNFKCAESYETVVIKNLDPIKEKLIQFSAVGQTDLRYESATQELILNHKADFNFLINEIFDENHEYSPISEFEFQIIFSQIQKMICYDLSFLAFNSKNEIVGFILNAFSDHTLFLKTIGFKKEYRQQGLSVFKILAHLFENLNSNPHLEVRKAIICLMKKNNFPSLISQFVGESKNEYVLLEKII
jgi:hypothetical protein